MISQQYVTTFPYLPNEFDHVGGCRHFLVATPVYIPQCAVILCQHLEGVAMTDPLSLGAADYPFFVWLRKHTPDTKE